MAAMQKPAKKAAAKTQRGFTDEERAAMKERVKELKATGLREDGERDVLAKLAEMPESDRIMGERIHAIMKATAPDLVPRTWYGMPAYTNADGKVVVAFKNAGKFNLRYSTLEFQAAAHLDEGDAWPVSFAIGKWSPQVEKKVVELMAAAIS